MKPKGLTDGDEGKSRRRRQRCPARRRCRGAAVVGLPIVAGKETVFHPKVGAGGAV